MADYNDNIYTYTKFYIKNKKCIDVWYRNGIDSGKVWLMWLQMKKRHLLMYNRRKIHHPSNGFDGWSYHYVKLWSYATYFTHPIPFFYLKYCEKVGKKTKHDNDSKGLKYYDM